MAISAANGGMLGWALGHGQPARRPFCDDLRGGQEVSRLENSAGALSFFLLTIEACSYLPKIAPMIIVYCSPMQILVLVRDTMATQRLSQPFEVPLVVNETSPNTRAVLTPLKPIYNTVNDARTPNATC